MFEIAGGILLAIGILVALVSAIMHFRVVVPLLCTAALIAVIIAMASGG